MSNKLTLTCNSVEAPGGFQFPLLVTSHSDLPEALLSYTEPAACYCVVGVVVCKLLLLSNIECRHCCSCLLVNCRLFLHSSPGFRSLVRLFSGPRTADSALLYIRPSDPCDLCVKRSPLTSQDWVSFIRFFCTPTHLLHPSSL